MTNFEQAIALYGVLNQLFPAPASLHPYYVRAWLDDCHALGLLTANERILMRAFYGRE